MLKHFIVLWKKKSFFSQGKTTSSLFGGKKLCFCVYRNHVFFTKPLSTIIVSQLFKSIPASQVLFLLVPVGHWSQQLQRAALICFVDFIQAQFEKPARYEIKA